MGKSVIEASWYVIMGFAIYRDSNGFTLLAISK